MKQLHKGVILFLVLVLFSTNDVVGQGGLHVYFGSTGMQNSLAEYTPDGTALSGYHAGGDFSFAGEDMYFVVGVQYHNVDLMPSEEFTLFDPEVSVSIIKPRVGLGFNVFRIKEIFKLRLKVLASIDAISESEEARDFTSNTPLNSATASGIGGLGVSVGPARVDLEYHRGFVNAYNMVSGSNYNYWLFNVGFFF
jgi:hypothetical protein